MQVKPSKEEILSFLKSCDENIQNNRSDFEEGTYESGARDAILWLLGYIKTPLGE